MMATIADNEDKNNNDMSPDRDNTLRQRRTEHHQQAKEELEVEICRVCRTEATAEQPLFYPCLCSGSIRYIHQECLVEWLRHSRKKYCELCKHEYTFSNLQHQQQRTSQQPMLVPFKTMWRLAVALGGLLGSLTRKMAVLACWLVLLPWGLTRSFEALSGGYSLFAILADYSGNREGFASATLFHFLLDEAQGWGVMAAVMLFLLVLMLMRDFLQGIGYFTDSSAAGVNATTSVAMAAPTTTTAPAPTTSNNEEEEGNGITAKEYRAFIRRQKLYREHLEREQARLKNGDQEDHNNNNEDEESTIRAAPPSGVASVATTTASVVDIRCRICSSRTCINLDHVRLASQRQRQARFNAENSAAANGNNVVANTANNAVANTTLNIDEDTLVITFDDLIGLEGPVWHLPRNVSIAYVVAMFLLLMSFITPHWIGSVAWMCAAGDDAGRDSMARMSAFSARMAAGAVLAIWRCGINDGSACWSAFMAARSLEIESMQFGGAVPFDLTREATPLVLGWSLILCGTWVAYWQARRSSMNPLVLQCFRFAGAMVKFALMIGMEMGVFPIYCGYMVRTALGPILPAALSSNVFGSGGMQALIFLGHWVIGIGFMLWVSLAVGWIRKAFRPGLLHMLRDPRSADFQPVREIILHPLSIQFLRLGTSNLFAYVFLLSLGKSAVLYAVLAWSLLRTWAMACRLLLPEFTLVFSFANPITQVPIDVFLHTIMRVLVDTLLSGSLGGVVAKGLEWVFRSFARQLALESFLFGTETGVRPVSSYRWVPALNHRQYSRTTLQEWSDRPVEPLDLAAATGTDDNRRNSEFMVVYVPDRFRLNMGVFLVASIGVSVLLLLAGIFLPILLGRALIATMLPLSAPIHHEMYSFTCGWAVMLLMAHLVSCVPTLRSGGALLGFLARAVVLIGVVLVAWPLLLGLLGECLIRPFYNNSLGFIFNNTSGSKAAPLFPNTVMLEWPLTIWMLGLPFLKTAFSFRRFWMHAATLSELSALVAQHGLIRAVLVVYPFWKTIWHVLLPVSVALLCSLVIPTCIVFLVYPLVMNEPLLHRMHSLAHILFVSIFASVLSVRFLYGKIKTALRERLFWNEFLRNGGNGMIANRPQ